MCLHCVFFKCPFKHSQCVSEPVDLLLQQKQVEVYTLRNTTWTINIIRKMFCGLMKQNLNCLGRIINNAYGAKRAELSDIKALSHQVWWMDHVDLGLLCCFRATFHHQGKNEFQSSIQFNNILLIPKGKLQ